jgi:hypothetical protein
MELNNFFGLNILAARRHGSSPVRIDEVANVIGISSSNLFLFTMFDEQGEVGFHYVIDSVDISGHDLNNEFVRKSLAAVMASGEYILVWSMFEGSFKEPEMLFTSDWEIFSTFGVCFPDEDPVVELDKEVKKGESWKSLMQRATQVIQEKS